MMINIIFEKFPVELIIFKFPNFFMFLIGRTEQGYFSRSRYFCRTCKNLPNQTLGTVPMAAAARLELGFLKFKVLSSAL